MFIIDSDHRLIAAERADLAEWNAADLYEAARLFREGKLRLDPESALLTTENGRELAYEVSSMESLLGNWFLCRTPQTVDTESITEKSTSSTESLLAAGAAAAAMESLETEEELSILPLESPEEVPEGNEEETPAVEAELPEREPLVSETTQEAESVEHELEEEEELDLFPLELEEEEPTVPAENATPEESAPAKEQLDDEIEALLGIGEEEPEISLLSPEEEEEREEHQEREEEEELLPLLAEEEQIPELQDLEPAEEETVQEPLFPMPEAAETPEKPAEAEYAPWQEISEAFHPDLASNAARLELNEAEYAELIREFVQDSRSLKGQLLSENAQERNNATAILKDAIVLLHLAPLDRMLEFIAKATDSERSPIVEEYERLLDELERGLATVSTEETPPLSTEASAEPELAIPEAPAPKEAEELPPVEESPVETATAVPETPPAPEEEVPAATAETPEVAEAPESGAPESIAVEEFLQGVKPIPIEFSLQIASQELNLPEELVLEFINDFAKQGHEYLPVLIDDYQKKDLDHLQKTAHMLKGAASNLRIEAMVDNLYDLQFDNNLERAPQRIRLFAGQLMSLDNYLEQMNR